MKVFIACSASDRVSSKYKTMASTLATKLARCGHKLVFGGATTGMMGKVFMTFKYENQKIKAVADITNADEATSLECDACDIERNTFERTSKLFESSDVVLILPGGIGTMAELFGIIEEARTKRIKKPIILYNYENYYIPLMSMLRKMHEEHFVSEEDIKMINIVNEEESLINYLKRIGEK